MIKINNDLLYTKYVIDITIVFADDLGCVVVVVVVVMFVVTLCLFDFCVMKRTSHRRY
jgi:uncharacterized membrane protein YqgA involved in biofilm formation